MHDAGAWTMPEDERWSLYESWAKIYEDDLKEQLQEAAQAMQKSKKELQVTHLAELDRHALYCELTAHIELMASPKAYGSWRKSQMSQMSNDHAGLAQPA